MKAFIDDMSQHPSASALQLEETVNNLNSKGRLERLIGVQRFAGVRAELAHSMHPLRMIVNRDTGALKRGHFNKS